MYERQNVIPRAISNFPECKFVICILHSFKAILEGSMSDEKLISVLKINASACKCFTMLHQALSVF